VAKKQTHTLDFTPDFDFVVIAIYCAYRDYKLCADLNKTLGYSLEKKPDLEMKMGKKGTTSHFPYFLFLTEDEEEIYLISNKTSNHLFIPEFKQVDYFFVIKNLSRYTDVDQVMKNILSIKIISSAQELEPTEIKSAENFLMLEPTFETDETLPKLPPVK
jgi:hypothetical protein